MNKFFSVLGSTGSIGTQTLNVIDNIEGADVLALAAHSNIELLERQVKKYRPKLAVVFDDEKAREFKKKAPPCEVMSGEQGLTEAARICGADMVVNALSGGIGLKPTLAAIEAGITVGLANKESLVAGGKRVMDSARRKNVRILPIDSEHSAIFQCLRGADLNDVQRIILTASGGPFYGYTKERLKTVTVEDTLRHPSWKMGKKITVDSATLMNKGFEVIEAFWLFGVPLNKIEVVIHRQSIIHSMVEFKNGSIIAAMSPPDMRLPIFYALTYPECMANTFPRLDFTKLKNLSFGVPDEAAFPCLNLAYRALKSGGAMQAVLNDADEMAVQLFLDGEISFLEIPIVIETALDDEQKKQGVIF